MKKKGVLIGSIDCATNFMHAQLSTRKRGATQWFSKEKPMALFFEAGLSCYVVRVLLS